MTPVPLLCCLHPLLLTPVPDSTTLHISPAVSFLESNTKTRQGSQMQGEEPGWQEPEGISRKAWCLGRGGKALFTIAAGPATPLCPGHGSCLFFASAKASHPCLKARERKGLISLNHRGMAAVVRQGWIQDACESGAVSVRLPVVMALSLEGRKY